MTTVIEGLERFCLVRELPRIAQLIGGVVIEEADEPDVAWLNPVT
jgi:dihydroorotate dehydrogenase (NAD+) catalytic subunit